MAFLVHSSAGPGIFDYLDLDCALRGQRRRPLSFFPPLGSVSHPWPAFWRAVGAGLSSCCSPARIAVVSTFRYGFTRITVFLNTDTGARVFLNTFTVRACVFLNTQVRANIPALKRFLFGWVCFSLVTPADAVCLSCAGNDPACPGDSTCVLGLALSANAALMAGTAAAGAATVISMGSGGKYILPLSWLQFLKPSVLQTLLNLQNRAPVGTPMEIEKLSVPDLVRGMREGTVSDGDARMDLMRRLTETTLGDDEKEMIKMVCEIMPRRESLGVSSQSPVSSGEQGFQGLSNSFLPSLCKSSVASQTPLS